VPFTVRDFPGLVRALERHAEWKAELRRLLLTEELLALPQVVRDLTAQVQALATSHERLTAQVQALATSHERLTAQVQALATSHERLAAQVQALATSHERLTAQVQALATSHERLTANQASLTESVRQLSVEVRALTEAQRRTDARLDRVEDRLGRLQGSDLERQYRERAAGFFQRLLTRIRLVDHQDLAHRLDDAVEAGTLSPDDKAEILLADVVVRGRREDQDTYVLAEVSIVVDAEDVRRAATRARLLQRALSTAVLPAVAGTRLTPEAADAAQTTGVWRLLDGRAEAPTPPAA
jgi:outer membrane murein-binding lipoprotein Lpp